MIIKIASLNFNFYISKSLNAFLMDLFIVSSGLFI